MIATVYSLILTPHIIYLWILLLVHGIILFFFIRLAIPKRPEGWGVVTDAISQDTPLHAQTYDVFIVASYGKIIPDDILALPKKGTLNVHPSLLPLYRGPSPIESVLLDGNITVWMIISQHFSHYSRRLSSFSSGSKT
jgi:hypothetical protein